MRTPSFSTSVVSIQAHRPLSCLTCAGPEYDSVFRLPSGKAQVREVSVKAPMASTGLFCFLASVTAARSGASGSFGRGNGVWSGAEGAGSGSAACAGRTPLDTRSEAARAETVTTVVVTRLFGLRRRGGAKGRFGKGNPTGASIVKREIGRPGDGMGEPGRR
ncbi:hypothetical protein ACSDR0_14760 [Streptosporangium sp. G11]|uniref:hypothetical protein n=1 Tax=Streptosporangium sp. G11 TaxID=3436926 RepID=UPI003EBEE302